MAATIEQWMRDAAEEIYIQTCGIIARGYIESIIASHAPSDKDAEGLIWAVERWNLEVRNRPIKNVHYRTLDETWRQVMRHFGGDPDELVGPPPQYSAASEAAAQPTQWMKLPPRADYPSYKGIHARNDWCEKAGCIPVTKSEIEHNDH